jgi:hypothetical protein
VRLTLALIEVRSQVLRGYVRRPRPASPGSTTEVEAGRRMFRSHGGTVLTVAGRDLLSEASAPSSVTPCREWHAGRGADTSAILLRVGTVTVGTAPAFGRSFASRYGSDLLPLRLLSLLQCGGVVCHAASLRRLTSLAGLAHSPPSYFPCAPFPFDGVGPFGGVVPPGNAIAFWSAQ